MRFIAACPPDLSRASSRQAHVEPRPPPQCSAAAARSAHHAAKLLPGQVPDGSSRRTPDPTRSSPCVRATPVHRRRLEPLDLPERPARRFRGVWIIGRRAAPSGTDARSRPTLNSRRCSSTAARRRRVGKAGPGDLESSYPIHVSRSGKLIAYPDALPAGKSRVWDRPRAGGSLLVAYRSGRRSQQAGTSRITPGAAARRCARAAAPRAGRAAAEHDGVHRLVRLVLSITSKSPYAVRALAELGRTGGTAPVPIGELARRRDIPVQFLEQLFATLRRAGILKSQRGVKGGYNFARDPSSITVLEVVELLDGPIGREPRASSPRQPRRPARSSRRRRSPTSSTARPATPARRCTTFSCASN